MQKNNKAFITGIGTAVPRNKVPQASAAAFMVNSLGNDRVTARKINILYQATRIDERYSVLDDFDSAEGTGFFRKNGENNGFPGTGERMERYRQEACPLGVAAVKDLTQGKALGDITHLITVSCTGMYAPGLDIDLLKSLNLKGSVKRTCINFMGCYAAFNALKAADAIVRADAESKVLIVAVELCTLHFQRDTDKDQLLANSLFADGAAAVLVEGKASEGWNMSLEAFQCQLIPEGEGDMAWAIIDHGFKMRLSTYVPELLAGAADEALDELFSKMPISQEAITHYALHPGGRRVLESLERALSIPKSDNEAAYHVLNKYGNMSSATVLFVLKEKMKALQPEDDQTYVLSMAFGPGLTLEAGVLQFIHQ